MTQEDQNANAMQWKGSQRPSRLDRNFGLPGIKRIKPSKFDVLSHSPYAVVFLLLCAIPSVASDPRLPPRLPLPLALLVPVAAPSILPPISPSPFFPDSLNAPTWSSFWSNAFRASFSSRSMRSSSCTRPSLPGSRRRAKRKSSTLIFCRREYIANAAAAWHISNTKSVTISSRTLTVSGSGSDGKEGWGLGSPYARRRRRTICTN